MSTPKDKALAITPFEVEIINDAHVCTITHAAAVAHFFSIHWSKEEAQANATLYADAHNTYNSCQMLPSEMLEKLREAEKTIADLEATCHQMAHTITTFDNPDPE